MQPNNQQGLNRPGQGQPAQNTVQPPVAPIARVDNQAAIQAALNEPVAPAAPIASPMPVTPASAPPASPIVQPISPEAAPVSFAQPLSPPSLPVNQAQVETAEQNDNSSVSYDDESVTWVAREYIHRDKGTMWFVLFAIVVAVLIAVSIFLMRSWSFAILLGVIAVVVIVYSRRPPRELTYSLTEEGLVVDGKLHNFSGFKSFGVIRDGEEYSVMLIPTQRFQPGVTVYFPEEAGEEIVDILGSRLPMKDLKLDAVDRVVRLLRL